MKIKKKPPISPPEGEDVPNLVYHDGEEWRDLINSTRAKALTIDAAAFRWPLPMKSGRWPLPMKSGEALDAGTAAHTAILDPDRIDDLMLLPEIGFRSNADKAAWRLWLADLGAEDVEDASLKDEILDLARIAAAQNGKTIVTPAQLDTTRAMSASVLECSAARDVLTNGRCERSFRAYGLKARPDCLADGLLSDLKTTSKFDRFNWQSKELNYPFSLAWYERVMRCCDVPVGSWAWLVVESTPYRMAGDGMPRHRVKVVVAGEDARWEALNEVDKALDLYTSCKESDDWPAKEIPVELLM